MIVNRPAVFKGTEEEKAANRATHHFSTVMYDDGSFDETCIKCDCTRYSNIADHPCGQEVRELFDIETQERVSIWTLTKGVGSIETNDLAVILPDRAIELLNDFNDAEREDH